jgi:hypothetical protein
MNAYNGHAVIISESETETAVTAILDHHHRSGLRTGWGGTLIPTPHGLQEVVNLTEGTLRLPNGQEAQFLRLDTSDWLVNKQLSIVGQGDAPF